jgi:uncharacterized protein involved in exopolysaccharide biosynthesis
MNFSKLESIMSKLGVNSLADIARSLNTTPQAVSNWKARDQVPYHIVAKISNINKSDFESINKNITAPSLKTISYDNDTVSFSDILLILAEQLKVIVLVSFITVFMTFTYVQFIQKPMFQSSAIILLPEKAGANLGGLAGLASQFGVNIPAGAQADLSSPSLFPELIRSRTFSEKILNKKFYTEQYGKEMSLLAILTYGEETPSRSKNELISLALSSLSETLFFEKSLTSNFSTIRVITSEPVLSKNLADVVLVELESLNRFYKSQTVNEKTLFIESRIASVKSELEVSEGILKEFNEQNRQVTSPALELEQDRLVQEVEIQKGIFLTLKQQLELAKIEEIQKATIVQILDKPQVPLGATNKNLKLSLLVGAFLGVGLGVFLGFLRSYLDNDSMDERKKLRRVRFYFKKKAKDIILDYRVSGIISGFLLTGLPFYLGYKSKFPVFFGRYSSTLMMVIVIYILTLIITGLLFIYLYRKKIKNV